MRHHANHADPSGDEREQVQRESLSEKNYVIRPLFRYVTILGGALGTTGASLSGHQLVAMSTLLVTGVIIAGELWITKRRDDLFNKVVLQREVDPAVLRALTVHEAVRSGLLSSRDTVRLLQAAPDRNRVVTVKRIDRSS